MPFPFKEIATFVEQHSTLLASIISMESPSAGMIIGRLSSLFGASTFNPNQLMTLMSTNPNAGSMIQQFETDNASFLAAQLNAQATEMQNVRDREVQIVKATGRRDIALDLMAGCVTFAFMILCFMSLFMDLNKSQISSALVGNLGTCFALCISYYFGDSFQSRKSKT